MYILLTAADTLQGPNILVPWRILGIRLTPSRHQLPATCFWSCFPGSVAPFALWKSGAFWTKQKSFYKGHNTITYLRIFLEVGHLQPLPRHWTIYTWYILMVDTAVGSSSGGFLSDFGLWPHLKAAGLPSSSRFCWWESTRQVALLFGEATWVITETTILEKVKIAEKGKRVNVISMKSEVHLVREIGIEWYI